MCKKSALKRIECSNHRSFLGRQTPSAPFPSQFVATAPNYVPQSFTKYKFTYGPGTTTINGVTTSVVTVVEATFNPPATVLTNVNSNIYTQQSALCASSRGTTSIWTVPGGSTTGKSNNGLLLLMKPSNDNTHEYSFTSNVPGLDNNGYLGRRCDMYEGSDGKVSAVVAGSSKAYVYDEQGDRSWALNRTLTPPANVGSSDNYGYSAVTTVTCFAKRRFGVGATINKISSYIIYDDDDNGNQIVS